jgi:hypothetical protein
MNEDEVESDTSAVKESRQTEADSLPLVKDLFDLAFSLNSYIGEKELLKSNSDIFFEDLAKGNPQKIQSLFKDIEAGRGIVSSMVADCKSNSCKDFLLYFVDRFQEKTSDIIALLSPAGESLLEESNLRNLLSKIQVLALKIIAVYEVSKKQDFPLLEYLDKYLEKYRYQFIEDLLKKHTEHKNKLDLWDQPADSDNYQSDLVEYYPILHLKFIRTVFAYYTIYRFSDLEGGEKTFILGTIERVLVRLVTLQERIDLASSKITMKPEDVLQHIYALYNDLRVFCDYTRQYISEHKTFILKDKPIQLPNLSGVERKNPLQPEENLYLFIERSCAVCKYLFQTSLWEFLQKICYRLSLRLELYNIDQRDMESKAFSKGVYDIYRVPTLLYKSKLYSINPVEEEGEEPHGTVIRELLEFFGVLGLLNYEFIDGEKPLDPTRPLSPDTILIRRKPKKFKPAPPKREGEGEKTPPQPESPKRTPPVAGGGVGEGSEKKADKGKEEAKEKESKEEAKEKESKEENIFL